MPTARQLADNDFKASFRICSIRGTLYSRAMLRAFVRRSFRVYGPTTLREALAYVDDDQWLRVRGGMTPTAIVDEITREVFE
ncbi:MAG TPA: hypothetical protein VD931_12505 [Baekduia sp.]|nr:hypothetical protein [Baekduia sp.]